jgi:glycosyltransferase involved in cell wall biosynthesis
MTAAVHQFVPTFEPGATGAHMLELRRLVREDLGLESEIFAEHIRGDYDGMADGAHRFTEYGRAVAARTDDLLVYQMAIGSVVADFVRDRVTGRGQRRRLVLNHHNFTPPRFLQPWEAGVSYGVTWGEAQLRELAPVTRLGVAVSTFNEVELQRAGYEHTAVVPVLVDVDTMGARVDTELEARLLEGKRGADWFFIGRVAPNKCQHDLVKAFAAYRRLHDSHARLWLTGGVASGTYVTAIESMVADLDLTGAVTLTGPLPQDQVAAHFRTADAFVVLSEHEGFLVPILEAWWHRLPIVAYSAAAVPETLGDGGLLLRDKRPATVAAAVARVVGDRAVAAGLIEQGTRRLDTFSLARTRARFADVLVPLLT